MESREYLIWVAFYTELAKKLQGYISNRITLIEKIQHIYQSLNIKAPRLDSGETVIDIDPFTVFGLFNKGVTDTNRIAFLNGLSDAFSISAAVPEHFDGVPVLNNLNATYYRFSDDPERGKRDIDHLWELFIAALRFADTPSSENRNAFIGAFNEVKDLKGNRWKLTMGLYWVRPYTYINLDSRNRWFLKNPENMTEECIVKLKNISAMPTGEEYIAVCDMVADALKGGRYPYTNFPELSFYAWKVSEQVNQSQKKTVPEHEPGLPREALADDDVESVRYWLYAPGESASQWEEFYKEGIMAIGWEALGDLGSYVSKQEMKKRMQELYNPTLSYTMSVHATWQFANDIKPGDIVYAKKGVRLIVGRGVVTSDYEYDPRRTKYNHIRRVKWTNKGEWPHPGEAVTKTLTDITPYTDYLGKIRALFPEDSIDGGDRIGEKYPSYTKTDFLRDVYMDESTYETLVSLLVRKKNIIIQGSPGVGKTYVAKRLAYSILKEKNQNRVMMIQFHQSYSYEDFIMGFRPTQTGFELRRGPFYQFCKQAEIDNDNAYFFIIDEINRGNLSRIFGELFMLIENDKRSIELQLLYSDEKFSVPENVYIIGMMNTADRSLAMLDYALRRRFAFFNMKPGFSCDGFRNYQIKLGNPTFDRLIHCVESLNAEITDDESLGEGYCIGHSYFCGIKAVTDAALLSIVEYEIIPLLKEYWFDEPQKVKNWAQALRGAIH
jgi:5-methylcytosine-specific restriction enzyme B